MELYSYPKSGSIEQVYEEGQYKPPASSSHVAVSAEYMYDEGECDDQEAGSSLTVVPTVNVDKKAKQASNYDDEEELYDAVSVARSTSHLNDSTPQPAPDPLEASADNDNLIKINSALNQRLTRMQRCLGVTITILVLLVIGGGFTGYMFFSQAERRIAALESSYKQLLPVDSVRQLLQTSSGDINRRNDAGRSKLSDSLKLYCNQEIENATILLTKSIEQLSLTQDVQRNSTLMLVENKTSLIAGTLRKEFDQSSMNLSTMIQNNTRLVRSEINGLQGGISDTQLALQRFIQLSYVNCNFESGMCSWIQSCSDDFDWTWNSGPTTSQDTGPSTDHTHGTSEGHYLYIEASSPRSSGDYANIESALQAPTSGSHISFYYHMHGIGIGSFILYARSITGGDTTIWSRSRNQGDQWLHANVSVAMTTVYQFVFKATIGGDFKGDIAIDDITITSDSCHG